MQAFHNNPAIQKKYIERVKAHFDMDEIIKGTYWKNGQGCAVGCTVHSENHGNFETELGIPLALAKLEDTIFEGLPNSIAKEFPGRFLQTIQLGADLSTVSWKFLYWLLTDSKIPGFKDPLVSEPVKQCAEVISAAARGEPISESAAESAAWSAWSAAFVLFADKLIELISASRKAA